MYRDEEDKQVKEHWLTALRRYPTSVHITGIFAGGMGLMVVVQSVAMVIQTFINTVLSPIVQWLIK